MSAMQDPSRSDDGDLAEADADADDGASLLRSTAPLGEIDPGPDFLAGVQKKLHVRSGGKFYRSRWSTSPMSVTVQIVSLAMLLVIVLIWLFSGPVKDLGPDRGAPAAGQGEGQPQRQPVKIRIQGPEPASPE